LHFLLSVARLSVFVLSLTLPFAAHAQQAAPREAILDLFLDVARVFDSMGIVPDWDEGDLLALQDGAFELTDPRTGRAYRTAEGRPLPYYLFDPSLSPICDPTAGPPMATVLFIGGVHPDEVSPLYSSWRAFDLEGRTTRPNAAGVDLNRDFRSDNPQPETRFVRELIAAYRPTHVVSLHAPYGWLDYDGPGARGGASPQQVAAPVRGWLGRIRARAPGLRVESGFRTYPGSLGEYAGERLGIHTLTFEYSSKGAGLALEEWGVYAEALLESLRVLD